MASRQTRFPWQLLAGALVLILIGLLIGPREEPTREPTDTKMSETTRDYTSFFAGTDLEWSGWSMCPEPIRWTVDVRALETQLARREVRRMRQAVALWGAAAGIVTEFKGRQNLLYDNRTHQLIPEDGTPVKSRHIYLGAIKENVSSLMSGNVVGLAMPSRIIVQTRTIITGVAIVRASFVKELSLKSPAVLLGLYLHELGHVFGLGHATRPINAMYPSVRPHTILGPGDVRGVQRAAQICTNPWGAIIEPQEQDVDTFSFSDFELSLITLDTP